MDWRFVDSNTLEESKTGFTISLRSGTWFNPVEIKPIIPQGMAALKQVELIRCGMTYVDELCHGGQEVG